MNLACLLIASDIYYAAGRRLFDKAYEKHQADEPFVGDGILYKPSSTTTYGYRRPKNDKQVYRLKRILRWYDEPYLESEPQYDTHYTHTSKSCKSSGGKKTGTCQPSASPSETPTNSQAPSSSPTTSSNPSTVPSEVPSFGPSVSTMPSVIPTKSPSSSPSNLPTQFPTKTPSSSPTLFPTEPPSPIPTTSVPSESPTEPPSDSPSQSPSTSPSTSPSILPTLSTIPTELVVETDQTTNGDIESTCVDDPPTTMGSTRPQIIAYKYNLYVTEEGNPSQIARSLEHQLHFALKNEFLQCEYNNDMFDVVSISTQPFDTVNSNSTCDTSNDPDPSVAGSLCVEVIGGLRLSVFFPSNANNNAGRQLQRRRAQTTNASPEVIETFEDFLKMSMEEGELSGEHVVQVSFQGLIKDQLVGGGTTIVETGAEGGTGGSASTTNGGDTDIVKIQAGEGDINPNNKGDGKVGVGTVAIAGTCFLLIAIFSVRKKRRRADYYDRHLDECGSQISSLHGYDKTERTGAPTNTIPLSDSDGMVRIHVIDSRERSNNIGNNVDDDSLYIENDGNHTTNHDIMADNQDQRSVMTPKIETELSNYHNHDVRLCTSATCSICRDRSLEPTFIPIIQENESQIALGELGPRRFEPNPDRSFEVPDTVKL